MKKGIKAFILAAALSVSLPLSSLAAFKDMPSGDDGACLQRAVDNNLLTGFEDETIRPADAITRAQMAAITDRAFGASQAADISSYTDVGGLGCAESTYEYSSHLSTSDFVVRLYAHSAAVCIFLAV